MTKRHSVTVELKRPGCHVAWGISIAGGSDLGTPLIVTRSENEQLQKGDVIKKIDEYDVRDLRHVDAQTLLQNTCCVKLAIERPKSQQCPALLPKSPIPAPQPIDIPEYQRIFSPSQFSPAHEHLDEVREERYYLSQPYRTTPLVLPGAKIKKDAPLGECYLRHHPNPMVRAAPHHYEVANPEVAMKQKVVSKQFNSPIGLYSEQNIADTIKCQASAIPKKPAKWDPNLSETYKVLQEEDYNDQRAQKVSQPTRQGLFSPAQRPRQNQPSSFRPKSPIVSNPYYTVNVVDNDGETIHQSSSFKRIMYTVLGETEY
ncbi:unnamed protein product [Trichogramma brassicae]|uniref:PDZ domain-containing protein n=1 Tax=Trichogramma brassicae TaxID=86971 RepID=A0A6H5J955_9HYME|nr:unnamed protein product [Trichogramma brassicae]